MSERRVETVLIGGGMAAAACAEALRAGGHEGEVALVGREPDPPSYRPACSKRYLQGHDSRADTQLHPVDWWGRRGVELLTGKSVTALDAGERTVKLSTRETIRFERALLATGALVRRLRAPGGELEGIHYLRTLGNADAIREDASRAQRAVVVGGSYIGCEVAASLTDMGVACTMLMPESEPLSLHFGETVGAFVGALLRERGIEIVAGEQLGSFAGDGSRVTHVVSDRGHAIAADLVVVGAGALPDATLARRAGLELGDSGGVKASAALETSAPGIFAAGDMCEYDSVLHGRPLRIEHWEAAAAQGRTVAANMLGAARPHTEVPYFWCDLADWLRLEYVGPARSGARQVVRGSPEDGAFSIWYLEQERLGGALTVGRPGDLEHARHLIASGQRPDEEALRDSSAELAGARAGD